MSPHAEGMKGTHHTDIVHIQAKKGKEKGGGNNPETMLERRTANNHAHLENIRPLTAQISYVKYCQNELKE